jgi:hypothetical protein
MIKVQFTNTIDKLNYIIGEKEFFNNETKEEIEQYINITIGIFNDTIKGQINYIIMKKDSETGTWYIPVNVNNLKNEL